MYKFVLAISSAVALTAMGACGNNDKGPGDPVANVDKDEYGTLSLALIGADDQGTQYRLRNASFDIYNYDYYYPYPYPYPPYPEPTSVNVSSETNPDDPFITQKLVPGSYIVQLANQDWYIERLTPSGPEVIAESVLLSEAQQYAYIYDREESAVYFRFGVDGKLIDFRAGALKIGVEFERPTVCGDGEVAGTEQCDGDNLLGQTCQTISWGYYTGGVLKCNSVCGLDQSGCTYGGTFDAGGTGGAPAADAAAD